MLLVEKDLNVEVMLINFSIWLTGKKAQGMGEVRKVDNLLSSDIQIHVNKFFRSVQMKLFSSSGKISHLFHGEFQEDRDQTIWFCISLGNLSFPNPFNLMERLFFC